MSKTRNKKMTLQKIADKSGVSIATVSRVLNNPESVDDITRQKVDKTLQEINYKKKKKLKNTQRIITLIIPDITNPFFASLVLGVQNTARLHNYYIIISECKDNQTLSEEYIQEVRDIGVAASIIVPGQGSLDTLNEISQNSSIPMVFLDRKIDNTNVNYVGSDNETGAYNATKYLLSLGHKDILYLAGIKNVSTERERYSGFINALNENDIDFNLNTHYVVGNYEFEESYKSVKQTIQNKVSFTAIFGASDSMCFGAKLAVEESGLKIPDDISLIGYDNIPFSLAIGLTTVSVPMYEMGKNAMLLILDLIEKRRVDTTNIILASNLVIRSSTKNASIKN